MVGRPLNNCVKYLNFCLSFIQNLKLLLDNNANINNTYEYLSSYNIILKANTTSMTKYEFLI